MPCKEEEESWAKLRKREKKKVEERRGESWAMEGKEEEES